MSANNKVAGLLTAVVAATCLCGSARSENAKPSETKAADKAYSDKLKKDYDANQRQLKDNKLSDKEKAQIAKEIQQKDFAEYKESTLNNLASIKELFAKAEDAWKNKNFRTAGSFYNSVALANVPGAEQMADTSRGRMTELEGLAKQHLAAAIDAESEANFSKVIDELMVITQEFSMTATSALATRRLVNIKGRPEVAAYLELSQAEALENNGKLLEAEALYKSVATNPRYEHSVAALKANRKLGDFKGNEEMQAKLKVELSSKADNEAPVLLLTAKNFISNKMTRQAREKLQQVIEKFPDSTYAEQARQKLTELE